MRIYLTQHGLAVAKDVDPDRPLSEQGRGDVRRLADFLGNAGIQVGQVLHSGKTRAEQTAAILADAVLPEGKPQAHAGLGPKDPLEKVSPEISFWSVDTLIVGHLPYLGQLALRAMEVRSTRRGRDRNTTRATLGPDLAVSAFPQYVPV